MKIVHKAFELTCSLTPLVVSERIESLLTHEGVKFNSADQRITSTRTPIAVIGINPKLYTRRNWVGLNPFAFISGIDIRCDSDSGGCSTRVSVCINRRRSILWAGFWALCAYLAARAMPQPAGVILFAIVILAAWFGYVLLLGECLVRKEILDGLKP